MSEKASPSTRIIVALDYPDEASAMQMVEQLDPVRCRLKVGKELFTRAGPALVRRLVGDGYDVFLDLKYHDIPNTVARACEAAAGLGVWMMNVHALGGPAMMQAARDAIGPAADGVPSLVAVTVLTSMDAAQLAAIGIDEAPQVVVQRLAGLAAGCGLDGVVCSPREVRVLRRARAADFLLVTPGVRPAGSAVDDQRRTATPAQAIADGASYLVIGRPVTQADDPVQALLTIESELAAGQP